ncbi:uroporphyrinogen-III synthase [Microbacterium sp.]|uniref:uroporphyrinogen-III synthase n=1 Tax=Microbacterium sp. TaxID=51671 RepID=UPI0032217531
MSGLTGARVLIPRGGAWGARVRDALVARGADAVVAPLIVSLPPRDLAARDAAFARLAAGEYAWLFVTSAATVEQLTNAGVDVPESTRIAVVGAATARAVAAAGWPIAFMPEGVSSGANLVAQWCVRHTPGRTGRCLVLRSDLAQPVVSDELELQGHAVDVGIAYRTVGVDLDPAVADDLGAGRIDAVLLTSLSVGRELKRQVQLPERVVVASIGPGTTRDAARIGIPVSLTSPVQTVDALIAELDAHLAGRDPRPHRNGGPS